MILLVIPNNASSFQQSMPPSQTLEIREKAGNVQTEAHTLAMMGQLLADKKGDRETAIAYLQESLAILQRLGSPDARTVQNILNRITGESR